MFFKGVCTRFGYTKTRGRSIDTEFTAAAGWALLERILYMQTWRALSGDSTEPAEMYSSRVVLNQGANGAPCTLAEQIADILDYAVSRGAISGYDITANLANIMLPHDEMRDVTCAQAIDRCLRYTPAVTAVYLPDRDRIVIRSIGTHDAAEYVDDSEVCVSYHESADDNVIGGVRVEVVRTGSANGRAVTKIDVDTAGDVSGFDALNATLQVAGREASRTNQRIDVVTEDIPENLNDKAFWVSKCSAVFANVDINYITIRNAARSGAADANRYPRITNTPVPDLEVAGLRARLERFTCLADLTRKDFATGEIIDIVEGLPIRMDLITTGAQTREYTWTADASSTGGEPVPDNLAEKLLEAHAHDGRAINVLLRLPPDGSGVFAETADHSAFPEIGDTYKNLVAQQIAYDLYTDTVAVSFGPPAHLSLQDQVALMVGFRTRRTSSLLQKTRMTGELEADNEIDMKMVTPTNVVQTGEGSRRKFVVADAGIDPVARRAAGTGSAVINLDPTLIEGSETIEPKKLIVTDGNGNKVEAQYLGTEDIDITLGSDGEAGGGLPPPCGHPGNMPGAGGGVGDTEDHPGDLVSDKDFDTDIPAGSDATHPGDSEGENGVTPESSGDCA